MDKLEAEQKFRKWVKRLWFAPSKVKKSCHAGNLVGRYVPFWTYDVECYADYTGKGGKYRSVEDEDGEEHIETDWFSVSGVVTDHFDDILVAAFLGFELWICRKILPLCGQRRNRKGVWAASV